ncbi:protein-export chaperone SecB [Candidatus Endolissoclinum faulkneri L2]|uniref:Protein-export protein SecB n=1 Tax=Candidatus Endolissoclinum faulkneri L2 TaxID=1193729 RepID=K7YF68_9PROT|nr:protein-export chaperone SecB [Candidatus Endolissoclinum faulkneri]AFX98220.1 protein-export chaperone SecB [Candidatus Endolissoclinum faulkneri L2]
MYESFIPPNQVMQLHIIAQYIKDFSFENPHAPTSLRLETLQPSIKVNIDVEASKVYNNEETFEVILKIRATAKTSKNSLFLADLSYAGLFKLQKIDKRYTKTILLIECPRLLFPFAREILASTTSNGGFPPLVIQPIDFATIYRQKKAQAIDISIPSP